jgi:arsenite methyltransferase
MIHRHTSMRGVIMTQSTPDDQLRQQVRDRYATAAITVLDTGTDTSCGESCCPPASAEVDERFGSALYSADERDSLPAAAVAASLGCGNPTAVADLVAGETVLDLGSGGGIDALLSARRVGPTGFVYGVDMTEQMLTLARTNATKAAATNVEFREGTIESIPLSDATVDVVISNCVINLSADKPTVINEIFRVLRPGGRIGISDVVAEDQLSAAERAVRGSYTGCIAGALSRGEYLALLTRAGFVDATVTFTHPAADAMHGAIIRATRPASVAAVDEQAGP